MYDEQPLGRREPPGRVAEADRLRLGRRLVGDDLPVGGRGDREREGRLEVGLLEDGEHPARVGDLELGVEVDGLVDRVDEAVQALAGVHVAAVAHARAARCRGARSSSVIRVPSKTSAGSSARPLSIDLVDLGPRPGR